MAQGLKFSRLPQPRGTEALLRSIDADPPIFLGSFHLDQSFRPSLPYIVPTIRVFHDSRHPAFLELNLGIH